MVSLYNDHSVQRVLLVLTDGRTSCRGVDVIGEAKQDIDAIVE